MTKPPLKPGTVVYARFVIDTPPVVEMPWGESVRCVPIDVRGHKTGDYVYLNAADLFTPAQAKAAILATKS